jgi:hypothetical protein
VTKNKGIRKPKPDPDALELDPEAPEAPNEEEDLDENELVTPSGDRHYLRGNNDRRSLLYRRDGSPTHTAICFSLR